MSSIASSLVWPDLATFLHMGGHGPFVWGSFGVAAVLVAAEVFALQSPRR